MTDLRTRIASVLSDHDPEGAALCEYHYEVADAVIRELNLAESCKGGCMWHIPDKIEDMTPEQRQALDMDKCYISGCTCGKPKYERQSPTGKPDPPGAWKARLGWPERDHR